MKRIVCALFMVILTAQLAFALIIPTPKGLVMEILKRGPQGPPGATQYRPKGAWSPSTSYSINDQVSYQGSSYVALVPNTNVIPVDGSTWSLLAAKGDVGPQGPKGDKGDRGIAGPQGTQGSPGPEGPTGPQGPVGPRGSTGPAGYSPQKGVDYYDGAPGPAGPKGDRGIQGDPGPMGPTGATGPAGPKGDKGIQGDPGPMGPTGATGPIGPKGPKGDKGDTGLQGPKGDAGPAGPAGPQGPQGVEGPQGPQGMAGGSTNWRGVYSPSTTYTKDDAVSYNGSSYIALATSTGITPGTDVNKWHVLAQRGSDGVTGPTGSAGPAGPKGDTGASVIWKGSWSAVTSYAINDAVTYNGSSYNALQPNTNVAPGTNGAIWMLIASKGTDGAQGAQGVQGPAGPNTLSSSTSVIVGSAGQVLYNNGGVVGAKALTAPDVGAATAAQGAKADAALQSADYKVKNIRAYGVTGNGTDEWALIQALIDTSSPGDTWYFPKGIYGYTSKLILPDGKAIRIIGDGIGSDTGEMPTGTTFKALAPISGALIFKNYTTGVVYGGEISNIAVDCNTMADVGIDIRSGKKFKLERLRVLDFKVEGVSVGDSTSGGSSRMFYEGVINDVTSGLQAYKWPTPSLRADYGLHLRMTASDNFVSNIVTPNVKSAGVYDQSAANIYSSIHPYGSPEAYTPQYCIYDGGAGNTWGHLSLDGCPVGMKITHNTSVNGAFVQKPSGWVGTVTGFEISDNTAGVQIEGVASNGMDTAYTILGTGTKGAGFRYNSELKPDPYAAGWGTDLTPPTKKDVYDKIETVVAGNGSGAPTDATFIVQTPSAGLSAEQALSLLPSGFLKVTSGTGVLTSDPSTYYKSGDYITATRLVNSGTLPVGTNAFNMYPTVENTDLVVVAATQKLNAAASYKAGFRLNYSIVPTEAHTTDFWTLLAIPIVKPSGGTSYNMNNLHGALFRLDLDGTYTGTITNGFTVDIQAPTLGGGAITNRYGLNIGNFGTGYAIKTGTGKVEFGDTISVSGFIVSGYEEKTASYTVSKDASKITLASGTATVTLPKSLLAGETSVMVVVAGAAASGVSFAAEAGGSLSWGDAGTPTFMNNKRARAVCVSDNVAATTAAAWDCVKGGNF